MSLSSPVPSALPSADGIAGDFVGRLLDWAARPGDRPALQSKIRGCWLLWSWSSVVTEIERLVSALRQRGVARGDAVALEGEVTIRLFLTAAAVRAAGGRILAVPVRALPADRKRVLADPTVVAVVAQGREAVTQWTAAAGSRRIPIVFDHATAGDRAPAPGVIAWPVFRAGATPGGWRPRRIAGGEDGGGMSSAGPIWVEETTDWRGGLDALLETWLECGHLLAFPEVLAAAARDRAESRPAAWIASAGRIDAAAAAIAGRLPRDGSWTGRLTAAARAGRRAPWAGLIVRRIRARAGLAGLSAIEVRDLPGRVPALESVRLFQSLRVAVPGLPVGDVRVFD